jgi:O-antigen ligase
MKSKNVTKGENMNDKIVGSDQLMNGIWPLSLPLWVVAFYAALLIIRPWELLLPGLATIHFERIYGILMILVVLISRNKQFRMTPQTATVILLLGGIYLSYLFAVDSELAWRDVYVYATLVLFFFMLVMVMRNPYDLAFMVMCYIVIMFAYLGKAQWEFFVHGAGEYRMGVWRLIGIETTLGGPNALANSIVLSLPFALFLWTVRKEFTFSWPQFLKILFPLLPILYSILALTSLILTNSRTGMLSLILFVVLVGFFWFRGIPKKVVSVFLGIVLLFAIWTVMPLEHKKRFETIWNPEAGPISAQYSAEGRIAGLKAGLTMFERYPFTGVGVGNFIEYRVSRIDNVRLEAHSLYGQILGETGLIGFLCFFAMVFVLFIDIRKVRVMARSYSDSTLGVLSWLSLACRDSLILLFFSGLFGHNLVRYNWLWIAALSSLALVFAKQRIENLKSDKISR